MCKYILTELFNFITSIPSRIVYAIETYRNVGGSLGVLHLFFALYSIIFLPVSLLFMIVTKAYEESDKNYYASIVFFSFIMITVDFWFWVYMRMVKRNLRNTGNMNNAKRMMQRWAVVHILVGTVALMAFYIANKFLTINNIPFALCITFLANFFLSAVIVTRGVPTFHVKYVLSWKAILVIYIVNLVLCAAGQGTLFIIFREKMPIAPLIMHLAYFVFTVPAMVDLYVFSKNLFALNRVRM